MSEENGTKIEVKVKPLSENAFKAFFQKIARWWLGGWYGFQSKHPKAAKQIYRVFFFLAFSVGVTLYQYLLFLFLPNAFGLELAKVEWLWPGWVLGKATSPEGVETVYRFALLGKTLVTNEVGEAVIGGGLGYFFAFLIATFTAQCINFPLQRNVTFKSKGNPYFQFMWYIIGWLIIQPFCDGLISIYRWLIGCVIGASLPVALTALLDTIITGGVSLVIFYFVFLVIFPDLNKMAAAAAKKAEKLRAINADKEKIEKAEQRAKELIEKAKIDNARKEEISCKSVAEAKAVAWDANVKRLEKLKNKGASAEEIAKTEADVERTYKEAYDAAVLFAEAEMAYAALKNE